MATREPVQSWEKILDAELGRRVSDSTRETYFRYVGDFVRFTGKERRFTRHDFTGWVDHLLAKGMSPASISTALAGVKRYVVWGLEENVPLSLQRLGVKPRPDQQHRPALTPGEVADLVEYAREEPTLASYMAMATTYGARRVELSRLTAGNFDLAAGTVRIEAAKGQPERHHALPKEILRVVQRACAEGQFKGLHPASMSGRFQVAARAVLGRHHQKGKIGWHAIRRSLNTELEMAGVGENIRRAFFGWRDPSMTGRYFRPGQVGADLDTLVFEKHPYLQFWR